jgi:predicted  nucleic acid-binding Zn-ribbon protein
MEITGFDIINIVAPLITLVGGWFFGRRKQKNDFLSDLQASIDLLAEKNKLLMEEVVKLREENACLREELTLLRKQLEKEVKKLKDLNKA